MEPLAKRMRPRTIDEVIGQSHILSPDSLLVRMIKNDRLSSIILYGPPGTGKTTIASVIANTTHADFQQVNAVSGGKKDLETVCKNAKKRLDEDGSKTILFIDEIHRFNKAQQDYLLPFVEDGVVTLIGATTENPFFEVNPALMSRSMLFELKHIEENDVRICIERALTDTERGLGNLNITAESEALSLIANMANGDIRHALSVLELASININDDENNTITLRNVESLIQRPHLQYDKDGDMHYDTISAFIKSMRGSDPDAALYYLARMLQSGEDIKFIARRIMIHACEDVGLADPMAIVVATACCLAVERIGMPEGQIILSEAVLYICNAPKSNSACVSIGKAMELVSFAGGLDIPDYLKDAHYKSAKKLGHGVDYKYPHDYPNAYVQQQYLPEKLKGVKLYMQTPNDFTPYRDIASDKKES